MSTVSITNRALIMSWTVSNNSLKLGRLLFVTTGSRNANSSTKTPSTCSCYINQNIHNTQKRTIFNLAGSTSRKKEHNGRKLVGYSMEQMFNVVSDVENYCKFVPWCKKSLVAYRKPTMLKAELVIGFPPINERYTSHVTLVNPHMVKAECTEGRLFNHLLTVWRFSPGLRANPISCVIDFQVTFEFRSLFHSNLANLFFDQVLLQMEAAFITEATRRFGKATIPVQIIEIRNPIKS